MFGETLFLAFRAIRRNALRSTLTALGIIIGVGAVIAMVTIGNGTTESVVSGISRLGSNLLSIRPGQWVDNWEQVTEGPITAPIACTDEAIFVACGNGSVYRFNSDRGWEEWRVRTPGVLTDQPVVLSDRIVQLVPGAGTYVLQRDRMADPDQQVIWKDPAPLHYLGGERDRMYFFDGQYLLCKEAASGKTLGRVKVKNADAMIPVANPDQSRLYLVSRTGLVTCIAGLNQPYLVIGQ